MTGLGTTVRRRLGPLEPLVSEAYRSRFINLDDFTATVASIVSPQRILEIGCGDGSVADRMCRQFPEARYLGVDIAPKPGRLFTGDRGRAEFHSQSSSELIAGNPSPFDLVLLVDVFHHLPERLRLPTLRDLDALCAHDGIIIVKDWERAPTIGHLACYISDRYISGDQNVHYDDRSELTRAISDGIPHGELICEARIPPRRNNIMFALRKQDYPRKQG
ncbi:MAG: methyltransferase [Solirubrobacteraceae bacterium]